MVEEERLGAGGAESGARPDASLIGSGVSVEWGGTEFRCFILHKSLTKKINHRSTS